MLLKYKIFKHTKHELCKASFGVVWLVSLVCFPGILRSTFLICLVCLSVQIYTIYNVDPQCRFHIIRPPALFIYSSRYIALADRPADGRTCHVPFSISAAMFPSVPAATMSFHRHHHILLRVSCVLQFHRSTD